jgi:hypothetical protein
MPTPANSVFLPRGAKVKCVDVRDCPVLTIGKVYELIIPHVRGHEFLRIVNDNGVPGGFLAFRFVVVDTERRTFGQTKPKRYDGMNTQILERR